MKYFICYIIGDIEFLKVIIREYFMYIFCIKRHDTVTDNINWLKTGGYEFERTLERNKDIPCEVTMFYINHLYKCVYEED